MKSIIKYIGEKFGKIIVLEYLGNKRVKYRCECGIEKNANFYDIKRGRIVTCGCSKQEEERRNLSREICLKLREEGVFYARWPKRRAHRFSFMWRMLNNNKRGIRHRKPNFLKLSDLDDQWEKQNGICPYSKINLIIPCQTLCKKVSIYRLASIDRIDSSLPYQVGNIQFVSRTLNYAKNSMSHDEFIEFLNLLVVNRTSFCAEEVETE